MTPQKIADVFLQDIAAWYEGKTSRRGAINTNVMAVGMVMIEHMAAAFPLKASTYTSAQQSQVKSLGGRKITEILARHGETRPFRSEGGRTSRGSLPLAQEFAALLNSSQAADSYTGANAGDQALVRFSIQGWIVKLLREQYFDKERIEAELDHRRPMKFAVNALLQAAGARGGTTAGAVAQHLVGAKLSLRFPDLDISNESYTTADQQTDRPGDFLVGDTAIHVTMSPGENLITNRSRANLHAGFRPLILVPEDRATGARQSVEIANLGGKVAVISIEDFVGTNVEEIATFSDQGIRTGLKDLLVRYNQRVQAVESDPSLQIAIPGNL